MTHDEMIEVIQAHKNGKVIQVRTAPSALWCTTIVPNWNFGFLEFRVKPQPKEYWLIPYKEKLGFSVSSYDPRNAVEGGDKVDIAGIIHVITVVEG